MPQASRDEAEEKILRRKLEQVSNIQRNRGVQCRPFCFSFQDNQRLNNILFETYAKFEEKDDERSTGFFSCSLNISNL